MLYGTDLKAVKLLDVFDLLSSDNFKQMAGKPKVVIVVACRNGKHCSILLHKILLFSLISQLLTVQIYLCKLSIYFYKKF